MLIVGSQLEKYLQKQLEEGNNRSRSGKYNPSAMGQCYRRQYWNRENKVPSNPIDLDTMRVFIRGNLRGTYLADLFPACDREVEVSTEHFHGFADIVTPSHVVELKSPGIWKFKKVSAKKGESNYDQYTRVLTECVDYVYQIGFYMLHLDKQHGELTFVDEGFNMVELPINIVDIREDIESEMGKLIAYWEAGEIPPAHPRLYNKSECKYCQFRDDCDKEEKPF